MEDLKSSQVERTKTDEYVNICMVPDKTVMDQGKLSDGTALQIKSPLVDGEIEQSTIVNTDFSVKLPPAAQLQYGVLICGLAEND